MNVLTLSILIGCSTFLFFIVLSIYLYEKRPKSRYTDGNDWLFYKFTEKFYEVIFTEDCDGVDACKKVFVDTESVERFSKILHIEPDYKSIASLRALGACIIVAGSIAGYFANIGFFIIGVVAGCVLIWYPTISIKSQALDKRSELESEIPRFLDLLQTALYLNMPIEQAILLTSGHVAGVIGNELKESIAKTQISATGWQKILQDMAMLYDIDIFTELVLDMITSYDKGVSISEAVARKAKDIRQTHLLQVKMKATKTTSTILLPVVIFKIVPMMAFMCVPMVVQIKQW